jgi:hypothetical protein
LRHNQTVHGGGGRSDRLEWLETGALTRRNRGDYQVAIRLVAKHGEERTIQIDNPIVRNAVVEERGRPRLYDKFQVDDSAGNSATGTCLLTVPQRRSGRPAANSGPHQTLCL